MAPPGPAPTTTLDDVLGVFRELDDPATPLTAGEVATAVGCSRRTAFGKLTTLAERGHLQSKKVGAHGRVWWRSAADHGGGSALPEAVPALVVDATGTVVRANERARNHLGIAPADLGDYAVRSGATDAPADCPLERGLRTGEAATGAPVRLPTAEGGHVWLSARVDPHTDVDGEVDRVGLVGTDVTQLDARIRRLERERGDLESELDAVLDRVTDAFYALDDEWRFTHVNERAEAILQRPADAVVGECIWEVFPEAAGGVVWERYHEAMETQEPVTFELFYDPLDVWVEVTAHPSETGLSVYFRDVTERTERERKLASQRERLAALNQLNGVVQEITHAVLESSTRAEIEALLCERLAMSDSYRFAWIGAVERDGARLQVRTVAGTEDVDDFTVGTEAADSPITRAARTGEMQVAGQLDERSSDADWLERAREHGARSVAAIPLAYDERIHGVVVLGSTRPAAFSADERVVIGQLGEIVGHALTALDRKRALTSERVVELRLRVADPLEAAVAPGSRVRFDRAVPTGDGTFLVYGRGPGETPGELSSLIETLPHAESVTVLDRSEERTRFELTLSESPILARVASFGGRVESAVIDDDGYEIVVHLPCGADVRGLVETVRARYPDADLIAQHRTTRTTRSIKHLKAALSEELTERQQVALEAAFFAGFFEWPRDSTGEDVAESLGISPATFHQHVRASERKLLQALFASDAGRRYDDTV
jgi:PAS domain S-box-containing protein